MKAATHIPSRRARYGWSWIRCVGRVSVRHRYLGFTRKKAALPVQKLLKSAVANAVENDGISDVDALVIDRIMVDEGPTLKRFMPRARGRATPIRKRTSHIRIMLRERDSH
jgi:large subunit ribosomal protein L22